MADLSDCLALYVKHLKYEKNLSPNTVRAYEADLQDFLSFLKAQDIEDPLKMDLPVFRSYLKALDEKKYKHRTIIRKYSSLMNFFHFLESNELTENPLSQLIAAPKRQKLFYHYLSEDEMERFLKTISGSGPIHIRDRALFELLYSTGARVSELANIRLKDMGLKKDEIIVYGKGKKYRTVYINREAKTWLSRYMAVRSSFLFVKKDGSYRSCDFLFLNNRGGPLSTRMIRKNLNKYMQKAAIEKHITPHGIRHSFATHLIEEGAGIREIQELLGHESIFTTQIYTHMNVRKIKKDFSKYHPRAK